MLLTPELELIARLPKNWLKFEALKRLPMTRPQLSYPSLPSFATLTHIETPQETVTRRPFVFSQGTAVGYHLGAVYLCPDADVDEERPDRIGIQSGSTRGQ